MRPQFTNVTDKQTGAQTDGRHAMAISRFAKDSASRGKNIYRVGQKNGANGATLFYGLYL